MRYQLVLNYCHFNYAHDYQTQTERQDNSEYNFVLIRCLLRGHLRVMDYLFSSFNSRQNDFRLVYAQPLVCIRAMRSAVLQEAIISMPVERTPCIHRLAAVFQHTLRRQSIEVSSPCAAVFLEESFQSLRNEVMLASLPQTANVMLQHALHFRIGWPEYALVIHAVGVAVYVGVRLDAIRRKVRAACQ